MKRQLDEWLKNQYVYPQPFGMVELNAFFHSPADAFYISSALVVAPSPSRTFIDVTVPVGETWLLVSAGYDLTAQTASLPVDCTSEFYIIPARASSIQDYLHNAMVSYFKGIIGIISSGSYRADLSHDRYLEGGTIIRVNVQNASSGAALNVQSHLFVIPVGKDIR